MEAEGSSPCSQQPVTGPYLRPDALTFPNYSPKIHFNITFLFMPRSIEWYSGIPTEVLYAFLISPMRATYSAHLIVLHMITLMIYGKA